MVLLVERLSHSLKFFSKLDNHHHHGLQHHHPEATLSASLEAFRSEVSNSFKKLVLNSKPGSEIMSLTWILQCFELFSIINKAFTKLLVDIDYPVDQWEKGTSSMEEYLNYTLNLLDSLNSISSSLSNLSQTRLALSHALSLVENSPSMATERLKTIDHHQLESFSRKKNYYWNEENETKEGGEESRRSSSFSRKEEFVIHQALIVLKTIGFWVCGIVLSSLSGDAKTYLELMKKKLDDGGFDENSLFIELDSSIFGEIGEKRRGVLLKEVKEVNEAVDLVVDFLATGKKGGDDDDAAEELGRRLEVLEEMLEGIEKEVHHLFAEVMAGRDELLHCFGHKK